MISIGIVEDHHMLRTALVNLINDHDNIEVILQAANGKDLFNRLNEDNIPDVILMDIEMPIMDGPTAVLEFRKIYGDRTKILGLSIHKEIRLVHEMIEKGANGFVTKATSSEELFEAINKVHRNGYYVSKDLARLIKSMDYPDGKDGLLNSTEEAILRLLCEEKTNEEIADVLTLSRNTINTYRTRMIEKLKVKNTVGLVLYAIKSGLHWIKE